MYNPRQNQGRRKDQVESSEKIANISIAVALIILGILLVVDLVKHLSW